MGSTTIHPFPELASLAEEEARARVVAFAAIEGAACAPDGDVSILAAVELRLLCDLTRPASRDAVARLVAARVKLACGTTAPAFRIRDAESPMRWVLVGAWDEREFTYECPRGYVPPEPGVWLLVPSLAGVTDPAEALALIVRHLWPQESP